jgi:hypothetical protein
MSWENVMKKCHEKMSWENGEVWKEAFMSSYNPFFLQYCTVASATLHLVVK